MNLKQAALVAKATERARELGYAIAVHGSMIRDLDLVAIPWVVDAAPSDTLAEAIREAVGGYWLKAENGHAGSGPENKPHGRIAYSIYGLSGAGPARYLDLSIMPRVP